MKITKRYTHNNAIDSKKLDFIRYGAINLVFNYRLIISKNTICERKQESFTCTII